MMRRFERKAKVPGEENLCIKFVPRESQEDYVEIIKGKGCYSMVN
jgi:hypothetical protein